jgi:hypothetical protein
MMIFYPTLDLRRGSEIIEIRLDLSDSNYGIDIAYRIIWFPPFFSRSIPESGGSGRGMVFFDDHADDDQRIKNISL